MLPHAPETLAYAATFRGCHESPMGSNDAIWLRQMLRGTQWRPGSAYCLFGAVACIAVGFGGYDKLPACIQLDGSCSDAAITAHDIASDAAILAEHHNALSRTPAIGAIMLLRGGPRTHRHAGLVVALGPAPGRIRTFEFNHNDQAGFVEREIADADYVLY